MIVISKGENLIEKIYFISIRKKANKMIVIFYRNLCTIINPIQLQNAL